MLQSETVVAVDLGHQTGFLVPALLPSAPPEMPAAPAATAAGDAPSAPVYIACYTGERLLTYNSYETARLKQRCSLPAGFFEQLLAGLLKLSSASGLGAYEPVMSRNYAMVRLGRYTVELEPDASLNAIKLTFHMANFSSLLQQCVQVINNCVETRYSQLRYHLLTPLDGSTMVCIASIQEHHARRANRMPFVVQRREFDGAELRTRFSSLLPCADRGRDSMFHVFVSYRHGDDSQHTSAFVNALCRLPIGQHGTYPSVYYDCQCQEDGQQFDRSFLVGLTRSLVVTPFVTTHALARMADPKRLAVTDWVLLEWWLAVLLYHDPRGMAAQAVLPIFCGKIEPDSISDLFDGFRLEGFPDQVNEPT